MQRQARSISPFGVPWDLPLADLDAGVERSAGDLESLAGSRLLVTGGTGFLGSWLVASLIRANALLGLGLRLVVVTRDPRATPLGDIEVVELLEGDVRTLPDPGAVDVVVHGAASSSAPHRQGEGDARQMAATIVGGTQAVLELAARHRARVLFLSSGAVYGPQTVAVAETDASAPEPTDPRSTYAQAKRLAETLCAAATASGDLQAVIARLFAFVGPRIPLDAHFAAGNFLGDALGGRAIVVRSDGEPRRSYLYTGDLPEWCWALLARGRPGVAYNVGSPEPVTIRELAGRVARLASPAVGVDVQGSPSGAPAPWYVPFTARAASELGLEVRTGLDEALARTFAWLVSRRAG